MTRTFLLLFLFFTPPLSAEPSAAIARMINTPASAFDLFLFRIYEAAKCNNVVKNSNADEADLCLSSLSYDADTNQLSAFFRVLPAAAVMDEFVDEEAEERKAILLQLLDNTAKRFGAVDGWGLLHSIPLGHGLQNSVEAEKTFRRELANNSLISLSTSYDGVVYVAKRLPGGEIKYLSNK